MTFRYSASLGGFDDTPLVEFTRDKELTALREYFYTVSGVPHLTCVVQYQDALIPVDATQAAQELPRASNTTNHRGDSPSTSRKKRSTSAPDPCAGLNESERALFNHLREWRSQLAQKEGLPPYVILTNKQVVAIIRGRPDSPTALGHIEGVGPGKLKNYGSAILELLHGTKASESGSKPHPSPLLDDRSSSESTTGEDGTDSIKETPAEATALVGNEGQIQP
jgi:hypothetical protein